MLCKKCLKEKSIDEFTKNKSKKSGHESICGECRRAHMREYHARTKSKRLEVTYKSRAKRKEENLQRIIKFLLEHPCIDCGESDILVLDFDHISGKKLHSISEMVHYSWKFISDEMVKCAVRCANCHRRKTAKERGWRKLAGVV